MLSEQFKYGNQRIAYVPVAPFTQINLNPSMDK